MKSLEKIALKEKLYLIGELHVDKYFVDEFLLRPICIWPISHGQLSGIRLFCNEFSWDHFLPIYKIWKKLHISSTTTLHITLINTYSYFKLSSLANGVNFCTPHFRNYLHGRAGAESLLGRAELNRIFPKHEVTVHITTWNMNGEVSEIDILVFCVLIL